MQFSYVHRSTIKTPQSISDINFLLVWIPFLCHQLMLHYETANSTDNIVIVEKAFIWDMFAVKNV